MNKKPSKRWRLRRVFDATGEHEYQLLLNADEDWDVRVIGANDSWYYNIYFDDGDEDGPEDYSSAEKAMLAAEWYLAQRAYREERRQQRVLDRLGYSVAVGGKLRRKANG